MLALTIFKNIYDNQTNKHMEFKNWEQFEKLLYGLSEIERADKKSAYLISPAVYEPDTTRKNANVIEWAGWAAVDVDDHNFKGDLQNELLDRYGAWRFVCYSTASSSSVHPKFRIVFPLTQTVRADSIRSFWHALNIELGSVGDRQCKDLSRMYYIPARYASANNFIFSNHSGSAMDPYALIEKHPAPVSTTGKSFIDRLPESIQKEIVKYRAEAMQSTKKKVNWSSYRDCPFVNQNLVKEYASIAGTDGTGRYAMIYRIMTSIAVNAIRQEYPITANEIAELIRELDQETSNRYQNRNLVLESDRAIEFAYRNL